MRLVRSVDLLVSVLGGLKGYKRSADSRINILLSKKELLMLHLKYRPTTLDEVVGNEEIKKVLLSGITSPILFCGPKGSGKTTLARITSSLFGVEDVDYVDCVFYSKIEDMRAKLDDFYGTSLFSDKKVIILDEVHALSDKSQQVFLTPLEKRLDNRLILACTTKVEGLIPTFLDRFKVLKVKPLSVKESKLLLNRICSLENIIISKEIQVILIERAEGSPRKLLIGLDTIRNISDIPEINYLLSIVSIDTDTDILELFKLLVSKSSWIIVKKSLNILLRSKQPEAIRQGLLSIIAARLMSDWFKDEEGNNLIVLYDCLDKADNIQKHNLIVNLYRYISR